VVHDPITDPPTDTAMLLFSNQTVKVWAYQTNFSSLNDMRGT